MMISENSKSSPNPSEKINNFEDLWEAPKGLTEETPAPYKLGALDLWAFGS